MEVTIHTSSVDRTSLAVFTAYALAHGAEHDDSYTGAEDLNDFDPDAEQAALAIDEHGEVVGACALMTAGYAGEGMARFRILHSSRPEAYRALVSHALGGTPRAVDNVFLFLPDRSSAEEPLAGLGFVESRRASLLHRPDLPSAQFTVPEGIALSIARPGEDAAVWAAVTNQAFAGDPGRYAATPGDALSRLSDPRVVPGGALIAWRDREPVGVAVGVVLIAREQQDDGRPMGSVETLAVVPEEQGGGIGRALLGTAIANSRAAGFAETALSTGATNARALSLYRSHGFEIIDVRVCFNLRRTDGGAWPAI